MKEHTSGEQSSFFAGTPITAFNYNLTVELFYDIPCKSVRNFTKKNAYEYIQQGGMNDYVIMKRKPITEPFTFQVERYVSSSLTDPLANGAELTAPVFLTVKKNYYGGEDDDKGRIYVFTGCVVTEKSFGDLDAEKPGLLTETVTIAYREMFVVPNIFSLGGL